MRVVATFHPPSSVVQSLKCRLSSDGLEYLVVGKVNRLEVFSLHADGLHRECVLEIWGRIVALKSIPVDDSGRSNLLVLTDHPDPKLIVLEYVMGELGAALTTKSELSVYDRYARQAEFVTDVLVDPSGQIAVVSCYVGKLKVVSFEHGAITPNSFDVSMPEFYVLALAFLHTEAGVYALAIMHYDHEQRLQLLARDLDIAHLELSPAPSATLPPTVLSAGTFPTLDAPPVLVAIPPHITADPDDVAAHLGGVLVLGGRRILFFEHASRERQDIKREKQARTSKRRASGNPDQVQKAIEKEKEREGRKVKPKIGVKWPWSEVTAWAQLDEEGRRFLIGDGYGRLAMLAFDDSPGLILIPLGETSPAVTLTHLTSQVVYLGSHYGDSQLLKIHSTPIANPDADTLPIPSGITTVSQSSLSPSDKGKERAGAGADTDDERDAKSGRVVATKGTFVEVLEAFQNIAPIMDAVLADLDGSGQPQIVTCSGGRNTGALKVVRTGADFQELAELENVPHARNIWALRARLDDAEDSHIVVSTLRETYAIRMESQDTFVRLEPSNDGLITSSPTLIMRNIPRRVVSTSGGRQTSSYVDSSLIVQITPEKIHLVNYDERLGVFSAVGKGWSPGDAYPALGNRRIVAADLNASQIVVALTGGRLVLLNLGEADQIQELKHRDFGEDIAAISCAPFDATKKFSKHIAVSFWGLNKVSILSLESAQTYMTTLCETAHLPALPCSLLLHNFGSGRSRKDENYLPHLLAGLTNGTLLSFTLSDAGLGDQKVYPLGDASVSLTKCEVDGRVAVFASGSRASVLFWERQRLNNSPVMLKDPVRGVSLNSAFFTSCLALATPTSVVVGHVRGVDKMQIRSIPTGIENPRRIAYNPALKLFGVACDRMTPPRIGDYEATLSYFKVVEDATFNQLSQFTCEAAEEVTAVLALPPGNSPRSPCFCIGTVQFQPEEREPSQGRVLLFSLSHPEGAASSANLSLRLLAMELVRGCVYQLVNIEGMIAAAVNTSVILFEVNIRGESVDLRKVSEWNHNYFVTSLVARGDQLIVGDAISSVSILKVVGLSLQNVARDYGPVWPVAVEAVGENGIIGANSDCNLFTFSLQPSDNRFILERDGSYHVDDVINKFLPGGMTTGELAGNELLKPEQLFFSSSGRIGVVLEMSDSISLQMTALQRNMAKVIKGSGNANHTTWRAPSNFRGPSDGEAAFGFLDGDFLEQFLTYKNPPELLEGEIEAERVEMSQGQIRDVLEKLQSLH